MNLVEIRQTEDVLNVYWILTDYCNFSCPYCPKTLHEGDFYSGRKAGWPTHAQIEKFVERLLAQAGSLPVNITLSGGEPTTHPSFKWIAENSGSLPVSVVTNLTRPLAWWQNLKVLPRTVVASLHPKETNIDRFNQTAVWLLENKVDVYVNLVLDPFQWDRVVELYNGLDKSLARRARPKIINFQGDSEYQTKSNGMVFGRNLEYSSEQKAWAASLPGMKVDQVDKFFCVTGTTDSGETVPVNAFKLIREDQNLFQGWKCSAGSRGITASFDGYVYAGICRIHRLGSFETFKLEPEYINCLYSQCGCPGDILLNKFKPR